MSTPEPDPTGDALLGAATLSIAGAVLTMFLLGTVILTGGEWPDAVGTYEGHDEAMTTGVMVVCAFCTLVAGVTLIAYKWRKACSKKTS